MTRSVTSALTAVTIGLCALACTATASAAPYTQSDTVYLYDEGSLLSEDDYTAAWETLENTATESGMHIGVWIGSTPMGTYATTSACDDTYDETFGVNTDGIFLYLDCSDESDLYDYISTSGLGQFYYTNSANCDRISAMWDHMMPYLSRGNEDLPSAIQAFCDDVVSYAAQGAPSDSYYVYDSDRGDYLILEDGDVQFVDTLPESYTTTREERMLRVLISAVVGLLVGALTLLLIRRRYRFQQPGSTSPYLQHGQVRFTERSDRFLHRHISRTRIAPDNNGSGGGHGGGMSHGSSFGGSHGGGGHHR